MDVYKSFALRLDREVLSEAYLEICTSPEAAPLERDLLAASSDLVSALKVLVIGEPADQNLTALASRKGAARRGLPKTWHF